MNMAMILAGVTLPKPTGFVRILEPNETTNKTMGGTIYTDFFNINRSWEVSYDLLKSTDYDSIYTIYLNQYRNHAYPILYFPAYSLNIPVKIEFDPQTIRYNGTLIEGFVMRVIEQYAIS